MRIVGGTWKGRSLETPNGRDTRPTTDRTREAIASMVLSEYGLDLSGRTILDAFAGSGAVSFELLSRGAESATLVDSSRVAERCIKKNAATLGAQSRVRVIVGDIFKFATRLTGTFDVLLLDPPYAMAADEIAQLIGTFRTAGILAADARIIYEHAADSPSLGLASATLVRQKRYSTSSVDLIRLDVRLDEE